MSSPYKKENDTSSKHRNKKNRNKVISDEFRADLKCQVVPPMVRKIAGHLLLGPKIGTSPVKSIVQCLARDPNTDEYFIVKVLTSNGTYGQGPAGNDVNEEGHGKMLLSNESQILKYLEGEPGVIKSHGLYEELCYQELAVQNQKHSVYSGYVVKRHVLVLDCLVRNDFNPESRHHINLQHHVLQEKKLSEKSTLEIFCKIVDIVARLHEKNVVHRDLKLGNIVLDLRTKNVTITNFCLGKILMRDELCMDQRGSPAYVSPEVLGGKPYHAKPSDMWALGVILFTMLYGQFPFYDPRPQELFQRIKRAQYELPGDQDVSEDLKIVIQNLLQVDPIKRWTAHSLETKLDKIVNTWKKTIVESELQIVPEFDPDQPVNPKSDDDEISHNRNQGNNLMMFNMLHFNNRDEDDPFSSPTDLASRPENQILENTKMKVSRVMEDCRPLTAEEFLKYGHLVIQQKPSNVSSTGQPLNQSGDSRAIVKRSPSPVLFNSNSPVMNAVRAHAASTSNNHLEPPITAFPAATPVPVLGGETVLDLSSNSPTNEPQQTPMEAPTNEDPPVMDQSRQVESQLEGKQMKNHIQRFINKCRGVPQQGSSHAKKQKLVKILQHKQSVNQQQHIPPPSTTVTQTDVTRNFLSNSSLQPLSTLQPMVSQHSQPVFSGNSTVTSEMLRHQEQTISNEPMPSTSSSYHEPSLFAIRNMSRSSLEQVTNTLTINSDPPIAQNRSSTSNQVPSTRRRKGQKRVREVQLQEANELSNVEQGLDPNNARVSVPSNNDFSKYSSSVSHTEPETSTTSCTLRNALMMINPEALKKSDEIISKSKKKE